MEMTTNLFVTEQTELAENSWNILLGKPLAKSQHELYMEQQIKLLNDIFN